MPSRQKGSCTKRARFAKNGPCSPPPFTAGFGRKTRKPALHQTNRVSNISRPAGSGHATCPEGRFECERQELTEIGLADTFRIGHTPALVSRTLTHTPVAVTRCRLDAPSHGPTSPIPAEDAYMLVLHLGARIPRELWLDGQSVHTEPMNPGEGALHDLRRRPAFKVYAPINSLNFYIPRRSLDACADDSDPGRIGELNFTPGVGVNDKSLAALGDALLPVFDRADQVNKLFVDHVTSAVVAHVAQAFGRMELKKQHPRGGLPVWQERRVKEFIEANLDGEVTVMQLARACGLSGHHFSRAFRRSTGMAPHQWLLQRRVDKAKQLLRDARLPLSQVAVFREFAHQSHFTRVFTRLVGVSPGQWQRQYRA
jgi:AraC family transcriptional regulator